MPAVDDNDRERQVKRNVRRTAAALWFIVAAIFFYMLAKFYWLNSK